MLDNIGLVSYSINFLGFAILIVLLAISWQRGVFGAYLLMVVAVEAVWSVLLAIASMKTDFPINWLVSAELVRLVAWSTFLLRILHSGGNSQFHPVMFKLFTGLLLVCLLAGVLTPMFSSYVFLGLGMHNFYLITVLLIVLGLMLTEQIYRNVKPEKRWTIKFLCLGSGGLFAYDLYVFSDALLFGEFDNALWSARGLVNVLIVPMLAITVSRMPNLSFDLFISRQAVFFTSGLVAAGAYLLLMAIGGYYIRLYGGSWGVVAQIIFLFAAVLVLAAVFSSGYTRGKIKQFLSTHFYKNKYDYREEWMRLIHNVYEYESPVYFKEKIIQTIAGLIQSRGGLLFMENDDHYECDAAWNASNTCNKIEHTTPLVQYINKTESVVDMHEYRENAGEYPGLVIPECMLELPSIWLIIPLKLHYRLLGFVVLLESPVQKFVNWEDRDLFKAAGRQISSYLAFLQTSAELAEAQQFSAFNRLSAYLVHDLKNLVSQLELITINANKHMDDPAFFKDSILTVDNVVTKAKKMLGQLRKFQFDATASKRVNVIDVVQNVVSRQSHSVPKPKLMTATGQYYVRVEPDRFESVLEHLIQNAQDATNHDGVIEVRVRDDSDFIVIEIMDTGCGMDQEFIRDRLFKPFDTTKGNAGMGIGVFEAREFVKYHGGSIEVISTPGEGTIFLMRLPNDKEEAH